MKSLKMLTTAAALTMLAAAFTGCTHTGQASQPATVPAPSPAMTLLSGTVTETLEASGYTYVSLEKDGKTTWVAAPRMDVVKGQQLQLIPGAEMRNFTSKTLNRTFDRIIFSAGVPDQGSARLPGAANDGLAESDEVVMTGKVVETMNAGNYSYLRIAKDGKAAWAAVPRLDLSVGDEVELAPGTPMGEFTSKSLERTFKSIYFAGGVNITKKNPLAHPALPAQDAPKEKAAPPQLPAGHPKLNAAAQAAPAPVHEAAAAVSGKVVETANAGGYTYLCLEKEGKKSWVAVPTMQAKVGDELSIAPGAVMSNFTSKPLNRTFENIVFSSGPIVK